MGVTTKLCAGVLVLGLLVFQGIAPANAQTALLGRPPQMLAPGVEYMTLVDGSPRNVVHVAKIATGAPVRIRAIPAPRRANGATLALPSQLCRLAQALVCVNGDFFGRNGVPIGGELVDGRWVRTPTPVQQQLWLDGHNHFSVGAMPAGALQSLGATNFSLVRNGHAMAIPGRSSFAVGRHARTLIGWDGAGNSFFVTVDQGRGSAGMSLAQAASLMLRLGATNAVNEDGGSSSQFVVNGTTRNAPLNGPKPVANVWAVVPASRR